jgi:endonuclease-3
MIVLFSRAFQFLEDEPGWRRGASMEKEAFDIDVVMGRIRKAVSPFPKAAMFELADDGYRSTFEQLVACIISIRTLDEVSVKAAQRLFARARTPDEMIRHSAEEIERLIYPCTFHERKAGQILAIARRVAQEFGGTLPCDEALILSFSGVGIKCANLALGIACGEARISVDIHVFRVTNRWGYIKSTTPEQATEALMRVLPKKYWIEINKLLVPFGKHICTGNLPYCSTCPVLEMCQQVGVTRRR